MILYKWIFVFSLVFLIACKDDKKTTHSEKSETETEIESTYNEVEDSQILEKIKEEQSKTLAEVTEELVPESEEKAVSETEELVPESEEELVSETEEEGESTELSQASYKCNVSNYQEYAYDFKKTDQLIAETGAGCYLPGVDFSGQDLAGAVFTKANLTGAIFRGVYLKRTKFIAADLTNAVLEDTNYMDAYFRSAILTGTRYNEYDSITAWIKVFSGQGIRNPESRGMIYTGK